MQIKQIKLKIHIYISGQAKPKQFSTLPVSAKVTFDKAVFIGGSLSIIHHFFQLKSVPLWWMC